MENKALKELITRRIEKYSERVAQKPALRNQLLLKNGKACMIQNGKAIECNEVNGYIQFPGNQYVERIDQVEVTLSFLPKGKMIVTNPNQTYCRGYKKGGNAEDCMIMLYVTSEFYDWLIIDLGEKDIPVIVAVGDGELEEDSLNSSFFKACELLFCGNNRYQISGDCDSNVKNTQEDEDDEWE